MKGHMKKLLISIPVLFLGSFCYADIQADGSNIFNADSHQVTITSFSATQVMSVDPFITRSYLINPSTWSAVCISSNSTITTTVAPIIPPNTSGSGTIFAMDGPSIPWWGALFAQACSPLNSSQLTVQTISVLRTK